VSHLDNCGSADDPETYALLVKLCWRLRRQLPQIYIPLFSSLVGTGPGVECRI